MAENLVRIRLETRKNGVEAVMKDIVDDLDAVGNCDNSHDRVSNPVSFIDSPQNHDRQYVEAYSCKTR